MPYTTEQRREYQARRRAAIRAELTAMLGGKCARCESTRDLQFDHVDQTTKLFTIASGLDRPRAELLAEVAKCQLLCGPHHKEKTAADNPGRRWAGNGQVRGEKHARSKMTDDVVRFVRESPLSLREVAALIGVSHSTVRSARQGCTWRHVQ